MSLKFTSIAVLLALVYSTPKPQSSASTPATKTQPAQTSGEDEKIQAAAAKTAQATINWDKSSTPGTRVRLELLKKGVVQGKPAVDYRLKVDGAPHDQRYKLFVWPITLANPVQMMDGLAVGNDGTVMCPADSAGTCAQRFKGTEVHLTYQPEIGEIYRQALISEDNKARVFFSVVPAPIIQNEKACSLEAVRLSPAFELALIRGKGFKPGEDISVHTQSYQETHNVPAKADEHGDFFFTITPAVKGRTAGVIEISAKATSCSLMISFNWGL